MTTVWHQMPEQIDALNLHLANAKTICLLNAK